MISPKSDSPKFETIELAALSRQIREFCGEREWDQFHGLKDLAIGLITESAEFLELFRFKSVAECEGMLDSSAREAIEDELADVLFFILRIADRYQIDLVKSLERKLKKNAAKYPVDKARGSNKKYTQL